MRFRGNIQKVIFVLALGVSMIFCTSLFWSSSALAETNSNDKLYGETLSSRGMQIKDCPSITAQYACIIDKNGDIIYERNSTDSAKIASLTKIMTAIVTLENCDLDDKLEISKKAYDVGESSAGFWPGDKLDMRTALYGMLVPSGNDAAQAISEYVGQKLIDDKDDRIREKTAQEVATEAKENGISEDEVDGVYIDDPERAFVRLMNLKAEELNCINTNFTNPHGLADGEYASDDQYCCALDIGNITRYAMQNEFFRKVVGGGDVNVTVERDNQTIPLRFNSTDILLANFEGCIGVKTGNTDIGGPCFSGALTDTDGTEIYTIVLKSENETQRFIDTQDLFNWYLTNKVDVDLSNTSVKETMKVGDDDEREVGVAAYVAHSEWVDCAFPVTVRDEDKQIPVLSVAGNVHLKIEPIQVSGSFKAGDKVAEMVLTQHNREIACVDLIAVKDQPGPNIFQMIGVMFDRLGRNISGNSTVAQTEILASCDNIR